MNNILVFFAIPVAIIILSIVLEKQLRSPWQVAAIFFAIFLVVTFAAFDASFLIFAIAYTILAYVTAILTRLICNLIEENLSDNDRNDNNCCCHRNRPTANEAANQSNRCNCTNQIRRVEEAVEGLSDTVCKINCLLEDVLAENQNNNNNNNCTCMCRRRR